MSHRETAYSSPSVIATFHGPSTWQLFLVIALAQVVASIALNRVVLSDQVLQTLLSPGGGGEGMLRAARRWEVIGYLASPILLGIRVSFAALLLQLFLLGLGVRPPFRRIFRAGLWAQVAILVGTLIQAVWLASLPEGMLGPATLAATPGSFGSILPPLGPNPGALMQLLHRTSVFDLGWIALYTLGLEERERVPAARAAFAVLAAWGAISVGKLAVLHSMVGFR